MAEVIVVAGAAGSFKALFQTLLDLVSAFRTAVQDVETAPGNTKELAVQVDNASTILKSLEKVQVSSVEDSEELLTPHITALGDQLLLALEKVQNDEQRKKNGKGVEMAKALFRRGASKQNKRSKEIRDRIRELMVDLSQAHYSCWKDVGLMTAASGNKAFSCPGTKIQDVGSSDNLRGARAGSAHEVLNSTKLRFTISYGGHENAYFYLIAYDKTSNKAPELFFPSDSKHDNKLERSQQRMFPDRDDYSDDPDSFKVEREDRPDGSTLTKDWVVWVYLILSNQPLHTASTPKIEELEQKLAEMVVLLLEKPKDVEFKDTQVEFKEEEEEEEETFIAVKRYSFDIINKSSS